MVRPFILTAEDQRRLKPKVLHHLTTYCQGRQSALKGRDLAWQFGYGDDRKVRLIIRELIAEGVPIASSVSEPMGFYIIRNGDEAREYMDVLKARIREDSDRLADFEKASREYSPPEQIGMGL